jgi:hypothetical protein
MSLLVILIILVLPFSRLAHRWMYHCYPSDDVDLALGMKALYQTSTPLSTYTSMDVHMSPGWVIPAGSLVSIQA